MDIKKEVEYSLAFYGANYDVVNEWVVRAGNKVYLGDKAGQSCRFCGKSEPEVTFGKVAHAIPESLGNKSIFSHYECDACNESFGGGIENDLGNWSKPMRTMMRIRGKSGVPSLKKDGPAGWRIDNKAGVFHISAHEENPPFQVDEANKQIKFTLIRDPYRPVGVLKALLKSALTLMPESEFPNFGEALDWVRDTDLSKPLVKGMFVAHSFYPGPHPPELTSVILLRRKPSVTNCPYMFMVLAFGNEALQVMVPSRSQDTHLTGKPMTLTPYPPMSVAYESAQFGEPDSRDVHLDGIDMVRGQQLIVTMRFDAMTAMSSGDGESSAG